MTDKTQIIDVENKDLFFITVDLVDILTAVAANYGMFFTSGRAYEIMNITEIHGTASISGTVTIEKLTGTTAKGSGIGVCSAISTASTANTLQTATLVSTSTAGVSDRQLRAGDRLAIKNGGTLTNGKDLQITVYLKPLGKGDYRL